MSLIDSQILATQNALNQLEIEESNRSSTAKRFTVNADYIEARKSLVSQLDTLREIKKKEVNQVTIDTNKPQDNTFRNLLLLGAAILLLI